MSVLVFAALADGKFKKSAKEAVYYAAQIAAQTGKQVTAVTLGTADAGEVASLGKSGANKVLHVNDARFNTFDSKAYTKAIAEAAQKENAEYVILSFDSKGKEVGPRLSAKLKAGIVSAAIALPTIDGGNVVVKRSVFSGKGFAYYSIKSAVKIISVNPNSLQFQESGLDAAVEAFSPSVSDADFTIKLITTEKEGGDSVPLPEAELVVSAGRGLKGPENWGMIEEMAKILGAATACSRAVTDVHWRPHHEHVGQTGLTIRPNLYIAIGISGAIQHLAGVSSSKTIVVINTDAEAPFFKAADYGIVGDAFEVVPKLNEALKKFMSGNN
jgi:electron transfer flavoprotein alpha subunit